jgi:predicted O-linked N-acetylglucosamine transferase (SPINDLY family)
MLFISNALPRRDLAQWYGEHRSWGQRYADVLPRYVHATAGPARRLRIGYVSADLREHATASFVHPILAHHNAEAFEIFCYSNSEEVDATTQNIQRQAQRWRAINGIDDAQAARLIHGDAIDILVDLSGHTRGNRLGVFARKPAPVQIGYLGYLNTSGMAAMDYRITDAIADPPGVSEGLHCETLLRLPQTLWCYQPPQDAPPVAPPPLLRNGHVTFGSFNHVAKLNESVLSLWSELMLRLPSSRLQLMAVPDEEAAARIHAAMRRHGIDAARVRTLPRLARGQYWNALGEVDIALDPFPYTGGATTCDSLWMGLPVVTLAGSFGFARSAATVLHNAGLGELVAVDERQYIDIALRRASDAPALADMRSGMRARLLHSPLLDAPRFVQALEQLYRDVWRKAVQPQQASC